MKRRPIWFLIIGIPLLIIALKYGECCIQDSSFAQAKKYYPPITITTTNSDSIFPPNIQFWNKVEKAEYDTISFPVVFILGFETGVRYGVAVHSMEPNYDIKQIMNHAKHWFIYNQLKDSTEVK